MSLYRCPQNNPHEYPCKSITKTIKPKLLTPNLKLRVNATMADFFGITFYCILVLGDHELRNTVGSCVVLVLTVLMILTILVVPCATFRWHWMILDRGNQMGHINKDRLGLILKLSSFILIQNENKGYKWKIIESLLLLRCETYLHKGHMRAIQAYHHFYL